MSRAIAGPLSIAESNRRGHAAKATRGFAVDVARAFTETEMMQNGVLVVWTKAQMRGVRATLRRMNVKGRTNGGR